MDPPPCQLVTAASGNIPDETIFRNLYTPNFQFQEERNELEYRSRHRRDAEYTFLLDDDNARPLGDLTHVGWKGRVEFALGGIKADRLKQPAVQNEIYRDPNALLNVTISTVMLLASGVYDIPIEHYLYTEMYLLSIRDEYNESPPNIADLIRHIRFIRQNNNIDWAEEYTEEHPLGVVINKLPNRSRIPKPVHSTPRPASRDGATNKCDNAIEGGEAVTKS